MGEIAVKSIHNIHENFRKVNLVNPYLFTKPFESTWKTDNTGVSSSNQIRLPLVSTGIYNMKVDWGDGTNSTITVWNQADVVHTYSSIGTYTIKISGICTGWSFNNGGDRVKILSIKRWGILNFSSSLNHFYGCNQLDLSLCEDAPNFGILTSLQNSFRNCGNITTIGNFNRWNTSLIQVFNFTLGGCVKFNQSIGHLNVSNGTDFSSMLESCTLFNNGGSTNINNLIFASTGNINMSRMFFNTLAFDQSIGNWNVSRVNNFTNFMSGKTATNFSTANLDAIYNGWSSRPVNPSITISFGTAKYTAASSAGKAILTGAPNNWVIVDGGI